MSGFLKLRLFNHDPLLVNPDHVAHFTVFDRFMDEDHEPGALVVTRNGKEFIVLETVEQIEMLLGMVASMQPAIDKMGDVGRTMPSACDKCGEPFDLYIDAMGASAPCEKCGNMLAGK